MSEEGNGKVTEVSFCYSDIHLKSSVNLFHVVFFLHLCKGKLINKRVIFQFHNKITIYIALCLVDLSFLGVCEEASYGGCL